MNKIAIIDYGVNNLFSVKEACVKVGLNPIITKERDTILSASGIILPGVGSFRTAMQNLAQLNIIDILISSIQDNVPFLGICLGFQLLFSGSDEFGETTGLNVFEGHVKRFDNKLNKRIKVPHVGWNKIEVYPERDTTETMIDGIDDGEYFYFVHSHFVETKDENILLTSTEYEGKTFCSSIQRGNLFASQFHPEKSGNNGIEIYNNYANCVKGKN
jgi:imidazole glycerol-phosphate synthase subunit HisH